MAHETPKFVLSVSRVNCFSRVAIAGMLFGCEQPFLSGERCVASQKTAAKETRWLDTGLFFFSAVMGMKKEWWESRERQTLKTICNSVI